MGECLVELSAPEPIGQATVFTRGFGGDALNLAAMAARLGTRVAAPILFDGSCDTAVFNWWLETQLCPLLNDTHVVVMDNAPSTKVPRPKS